MTRTLTIAAASALPIAAFSFAPAQDAPAPAEGMREMLPGIRVDRARRIVEFDGEVPITLEDVKAPRVYLELMVCTPDTKEHESLVVTRVRPSNVHAALLAIGLEPGRPARWTQEAGRVIPHAPTGDRLIVEFVTREEQGIERVWTPSDWVVNAKTGEAWPGGGEFGQGHWVFAGSVVEDRARRDDYFADEAGTLVGLTSFGTEAVAWTGVLSPDSTVDEPEWIAHIENVPPLGTPVTVRLRAEP